MPLPRYQPVKKKPKISGPSLDDLDDYCLSKIIGYALNLSRFSSTSSSDLSTVGGDSGETEKNLSLVSRRWYFLTQTKVASYGLHKIDLDKLVSSTKRNEMPQKIATVGARFPTIPRGPRVLTQKNLTIPSSNGVIMEPIHDGQQRSIYDINLFRKIQPRLMKYKHVQIDGFISYDEFKKLVIALNAFRTEELILNIKLDKNKILSKESQQHLPQQLPYLEKLVLFWSDNPKSFNSNALSWTVFLRATNLRYLEVYLNVNESLESNDSNSLDKRAANFLNSQQPETFNHSLLNQISFEKSNCDISKIDCIYTSLIKDVLIREHSIFQLQTNDSILVKHLVKLAERISTARRLEYLEFSAPLRDLILLTQLLESDLLGLKRLSIVVDNIELIKDVRNLIECSNVKCRLSLHLKDQKFPDNDDKINNLSHLSRLADLTININAQQRVSIDCCHLMWSVGRALSSSSSGRCLFKITLHTNPVKSITIPFGKFPNIFIGFGNGLNPTREDFARQREIMKALRRDCYHSFVKGVRDNVVV